MFAKVLLLVAVAQGAELQSSLLSESASAAQLQMQAENLRAMWLDYKSSEGELKSEHEGFSSSLIELQNRMTTTHQQELLATRNSAKVLEAMSMSLEAQAKKDTSLAVNALGEVKSMDAEMLAAAESKAEERLLAESQRTAQTAEATAESWMEAFVNSEDADLRLAVAEAEDAFRHLTGQRSSMEVIDKVQDFWRTNGVKTNAFGKNVAPVTKTDLLKNMDAAGADEKLEQMDKDQNGKITWQEAHEFFSRKAEEDREQKVASLAQTVTTEQGWASKEAVTAPTFEDGLDSQLAALDAFLVKALNAAPKPAALIEEKAEEKQEEKMQDKADVASRLESMTTSEGQVMKSQLLMDLSQYLDTSEQEKNEEKASREKRWAHILERQHSALLQQEQSVKAEEKELSKLEREEQWQMSKTVRTEQSVEESMQDSACAGQKTTVRAFITGSQSVEDSHAICLQSQLGACTKTEILDAPSMQCNELSAGWQKKCLADKAQEMADCAPMGVDWNAMRGGEKGVRADNEALQRLSEWCTMHRTLGKIEQSRTTAPFSLILSKNAAVSKDAVAKLADFGENFKGQEWDLLQVDPTGSPAPLHSVIVKSESAGKIKKAMSLMQATPLDKLPKALNDDPKYGSKAVAWNAGVSGMLQWTTADCSLESPALLQAKKEGLKSKLAAALR